MHGMSDTSYGSWLQSRYSDLQPLVKEAGVPIPQIRYEYVLAHVLFLCCGRCVKQINGTLFQPLLLYFDKMLHIFQ
jgi:hypothetical protein